MKRLRFQVLFYIRRDRKNNLGKVPIYLRVSINNETAKMSINRFTTVSDWDTKKGIIKKGKPDHEEINNHIDHLHKRIYDSQTYLIENELMVSANNSIKYLREQFSGLPSLLEIFQKHNDEKESMIGKGATMGSLKNYRLTYRHLVKFLKKTYDSKDMPIKNVNHQFLKDFELYMRVDNSNSNNGAMKNMVRLKKITRIALHSDLIKSDPFRNFKISFDKPDRVYLNTEELRTIESIPLASKKLVRVRDIFVFMCYTGLAFVDSKSLSRNMISIGADGNQWIIGNRIKSSVRYAIPILPAADSILNKYFDENKSLVLPVLSNQKMNDYLKEIAAICGINKPISCHSWSTYICNHCNA